MAIPMLDRGVSMNMVILTRKEPNAFDRNRFPDNFWLANLFGRATHNLVLSEELREAYELVDRELRVVADIQRALLPKQMPQIESLELAAYYRTISVTDGIYRAGRSAALTRIIHYCGSNCHYPLLALGVLLLVGLGVSRSAKLPLSPMVVGGE